MKLKAGSTALIASDGVASGRDDAWLRELLKEDETDMKALARRALQRAEEQHGAADDMTVIAVHIETR